MIALQLSRDKEAIVDACCQQPLTDIGQWSASHKKTNWYAVRNEVRADGRKKRVYLHQAVWALAGRDVPPGFQIDHENQNGLDNRLSNLRLATIQEQRRNHRKRQGCTSQYKGVCWCNQKQMWRATIKDGQKQYHLGFFPTNEEHEAARAYDEAACRLFGEFASPNLRKAG